MKSTGYKDKNGKEIFVGNTLKCDYGYNIVVFENEVGEFVGKLICEPNHVCANMSYHLNADISEVV